MRTTFNVGNNKAGSPTLEVSFEVGYCETDGEIVIDSGISLTMSHGDKSMSIRVPRSEFVEMARQIVRLLDESRK